MYAINPTNGPNEEGPNNPLENESFDSSPSEQSSSEPAQSGESSRDIIRQEREARSSEASKQPSRAPEITIEVASTKEAYQAIETLQQDIWGFADREILPYFFQEILAKTGSAILIAYDKSDIDLSAPDADPDQKGKPVGFSISILSRDDQTGEPYLYMDLLGVHPDYQSSGIGMKLQGHLRDHALENGIEVVRGTFDPMETRNARVYLNGIGAKVIAFERNYYGSDYASDYEQLETHRYTASWPLQNDGPPEFPESSTQLISIDADGLPSVETQELTTGKDHYIASVPINFREIKDQDQDLAKVWQDAVADISEALVGNGYLIENFRINKQTGYGEYLFLRQE